MTDPLLEAVLDHDELADLDPAERRLALRSLVAQTGHFADLAGPVSKLADEIDGYGPISDFMRDPHVTDVLVNGAHEVWVERAGKIARTDAEFAGDEALRDFIERWLGGAGVRIDSTHPIADTRLPDGARMHVVLPPVAPGGPLVSIRRFSHRPLGTQDLIRAGTLTSSEATFLVWCVRRRATLAISGETGAGKTTLLNALLAHVGGSERVVTIEETPELRPACAHAVSLVARGPNVEGRGYVGLPGLVRAALRMRPDRIVVGEVRGAEALTALGAMATGHRGSMVTLHAGSGRDAVERMTVLALEASSGASEVSLRRRVTDALDFVIHLERRDGTRRLAEVFAVG
jgi:pilus assembly protein CpaF